MNIAAQVIGNGKREFEIEFQDANAMMPTIAKLPQNSNENFRKAPR
jgi:hypothetical protein